MKRTLTDSKQPTKRQPRALDARELAAVIGGQDGGIGTTPTGIGTTPLGGG